MENQKKNQEKYLEVEQYKIERVNPFIYLETELNSNYY